MPPLDSFSAPVMNFIWYSKGTFNFLDSSSTLYLRDVCITAIMDSLLFMFLFEAILIP